MKIIAIVTFILIFAPINHALATDCFGNAGVATGGSISFSYPTPASFFQPVVTSPTPTVNSTTNAGASNSNDNNSNLSANAIFSSDSFTPSGIIEWVIFAILVLLVVILVRKMFDKTEKYYATPLKHD